MDQVLVHYKTLVSHIWIVQIRPVQQLIKLNLLEVLEVVERFIVNQTALGQALRLWK